jgi:hypothetical protein
MRQEDLFNNVCEMSKNTLDLGADWTVSTSTETTGRIPTNINTVFEDGEWWYYGDSTGRRRVTSHNKKNKNRMFVNGKYVPKSHPLWKAGNYKSFDEAAFSSLQNYERSNEGQVYIIVNPSWPDWVKIGMAVNAEDRLNSYQTGSPMRDYKLVYAVYTKDRRRAEREAHKAAEAIAERNGEWFKMSIGQAKECIQHGL